MSWSVGARESWKDPEIRARRQAAMRRPHPKARTSLVLRFWEKVRKPTGFAVLRGCWLWTGYQDKRRGRDCGYGQIQGGDKKLKKAHIVSWELHYGPVPKGKLVLHKCDNPPCVRPDHLFLGNHQNNSDDMVAKGRARGARGEDSAKAKLTEEQVQAIRSAPHVYGSRKFLAEKYAVSPDTIHAIRSGDTWAWLERECK